MNKQIVVLGMHRSGTSTIALILQAIGINMGEKLLGATPGNPYGHAEDEDFLNINELMLKESNGSWDFPPDKTALEKAFNNHYDEIENIITNKNKKKIWGWKEPRTTLFSGCYHQLLKNPYYICVHRNDMEVSQSLKKRNLMPIRKSFKLIDRYNNALQNFLKTCNPHHVIHINYSDFHNPNKDVITDIINFLEIQPTIEQIQKASEIIMPVNEINKERQKLKRQEKRKVYKKALMHPVKSVKLIMELCWRLLRYYI
ncbi:sulfotransferase [Virgibacillus doumboii]|uniref:sulfotransferase n=1 Tax=Virgibacillus doumboii TaxID=2697503 RepID=UPI0013DF380A|nr:sulfotransferase [Virgibacillus doumboii]